MKILFIGAVEFSEKMLKKLIKLNANIVGVCTLKKSTFNSDHKDLTPICIKNKIPIHYDPDLNSDNSLKWIKMLVPDIIFCFGWSRILKEKMLHIAPMGVLGYHPSALPANRGRHPLIWSLVLGLNKTASTFFFMDESADSGDILSQTSIKINNDDDARMLYCRMVETAESQIEEFLPLLESRNFKTVTQDHNKANIWRKRSTVDGNIDWRMSARAIYNLIRGLSKPYVGAHFVFDGKIIKVWEAKVVQCTVNNIEPGKVLENSEKGTLVKASENAILLIQTEPNLKVKTGTYL